MGDGLGHDGGVDDDAFGARLLHHAATPCGLDGGHHKVSTHSSPKRHLQRARLLGSMGLQSASTPRPEVLPVWVLDPSADDGFVGGIEGVLEVEQPGDRTRWQRGSTLSRGEGHGEGAFNLAPVDRPPKRSNGYLRLTSSSKRLMNRASVRGEEDWAPIEIYTGADALLNASPCTSGAEEIPQSIE